MLGKLIEQSEAGKCLVIGTIMADRLIIKQQKLSAFSGQFNMVKQGSHTLRCTVSAKYCYVTHELRLHQNDRCKRFTLF